MTTVLTTTGTGTILMSTTMHRIGLKTVLLLLLSVALCEAWTGRPHSQQRSADQSSFRLGVRRGRGSIGKDVGDGMGGRSTTGSTAGGGMKGDTAQSPPSGAVNWIPINVSVKSLPDEENRVGLIDTNLITMKNGQTNPTGAVSVIKYSGKIYCFAVNCPSCQIPLTKATCLPGAEGSSNQPRLVCDFCKATYNVKTGEKLESAVQNAGFLGGIAKSLFSAKDSAPLPVYKLGEKGGKLLIGLD